MQVNWRTVTWGLALQLLFALLILQTNAGYVAFSWMGKRVSDFQQYSDAGAAFVFGEDAYKHHFFAFKVRLCKIRFLHDIKAIDPNRNRTHETWITHPAPYRLSYRGS